MPEGIARFVVTQHATVVMRRRSIGEDVLKSILAVPDQRLVIRPGREVFQSKVSIVDKSYLVRVFVDVDRSPAEVVTVYRTSKISKYLEREP
jgi:hypothetical protein